MKFYQACERGDIETVQRWIVGVAKVIPVEIVMISMLTVIYI